MAETATLRRLICFNQAIERDRMDALATQWRAREVERAAAAAVATAAVAALEGRARKVRSPARRPASALHSWTI